MSTAKKKAAQPAKFDRNAEIRLRNVSDETYNELEAIMQRMKEGTQTGAINRIIATWKDDQETIAMLRKRNDELHRAIMVYHTRESEQAECVRDFMRQVKGYSANAIRNAEGNLKKFLKPKRAKKAAPKKTVKKGGKK
jgi:hypothetical protein